MKRKTLNYLVDAPLLVQSFVVCASGIALMFVSEGSRLLGFDWFVWFHAHKLVGLLMVSFSFIHVALHWKWLTRTTKSFFSSKRSSHVQYQTAYPVEE